MADKEDAALVLYPTGKEADRFENPGIPPHVHRMADHDPKAAKRAERQVATFFGLSILGTLITMVSYFYFQLDHHGSNDEMLQSVANSNRALGVGMAIALLGIGFGAVHWAKTLMPDEEMVEYRHSQRSSEEDREAALDILSTGNRDSGLGRRPLIRNTMLGALALFPLPGVLFLRDLGPLPGNALNETLWKKGVRLVLDPQETPIKASDLALGSVAHVLPEGLTWDNEDIEYMNEKAKAPVLLMRLQPEKLDDASREGSFEGIVAYSKICTHMGCPVALYEQQTHHLLCPCHQSTFDLTQNCKVIFGPAKRALPQLPITVDDNGYLIAADGFSEPVGPSFWERG